MKEVPLHKLQGLHPRGHWTDATEPADGLPETGKYPELFYKASH